MLRVPPVMQATLPSRAVASNCPSLGPSSRISTGDVPPSMEINEPVMPGAGVGRQQHGHRADVLDLVEPLDRRLPGVPGQELLVGHAHRLGRAGPSAFMMSVSMPPGHSTLTVMPSVPTSCAADFVSPLMACLAATYGLTTGLPTLPSSEPIADDPAPLVGDHVLERPAHHPERVPEDPRHREVHRLVGQLGDRGEVAAAAGVGHGDVDAGRSARRCRRRSPRSPRAGSRRRR